MQLLYVFLGIYLFIGFIWGIICFFVSKSLDKENPEPFTYKDFFRIMFCYPLGFFKKTRKFFFTEEVEEQKSSEQDVVGSL